MLQNVPQFRRKLIAWYEGAKRDLPWRDTRDPYRIWISEVMLQQTRVTAVIPYYRRFLQAFPTVAALAASTEEELLARWSGLGYYSRARNLRRAAQVVVERGDFPTELQAIRDLPGIGDYTAAAIASIAFNQPVAVVDGNVMRVVSRITADAGGIQSTATKKRIGEFAGRLVDPARPGEFNQAMMELGATVCLPRNPLCLVCPCSDDCQARRQGRQHDLPVREAKAAAVRETKSLLLISRGASVLLWRRPADSSRLAGFWELPEQQQLPQAVRGDAAGSFRHGIVNHVYRVDVVRASLERVPPGFEWVAESRLGEIPLSTMAAKALKQVPRVRSKS